MTTATIEPKSELAEELDRAATTGDVIIVRVGNTANTVNVERETPTGEGSLPTPEETEASREAIRAAAGSWRGIVDAEELRAYIRECRLTPGRGGWES